MLTKYHATKPISASFGKSLAGLLSRKWCLINILILRSEQVMFWALLLKNLLILNNKTGAKKLFQKPRSAGWLLLYSIAKDSIIGLALFSMSWLWGIDILIPVDCFTEDMFTLVGCVAAGAL